MNVISDLANEKSYEKKKIFSIGFMTFFWSGEQIPTKASERVDLSPENVLKESEIERWEKKEKRKVKDKMKVTKHSHRKLERGAARLRQAGNMPSSFAISAPYSLFHLEQGAGKQPISHHHLLSSLFIVCFTWSKAQANRQYLIIICYLRSL